MKNYLTKLDLTVKKLEKYPLDKFDKKVKYLKNAFDIAYENDLFALYKYDKNTQDKLKLELFSKLTKVSGSLSFLAIQILAANSIMAKNDFKRKDKYFNHKCGIAINHLRNPKTIVEAIKCDKGYLLNGTLTWTSGYEIFDKLLIGFHFEGKEYEVLANFKKAKGFNIIETPKTFVAQSLNTINVELKNFFVRQKDIVSSNDIGNYTRNKSLSKTIHYSLYGLGLGVLKDIENEELKNYSKKLLKQQKKKFLKSNNPDELDDLRVELFEIVLNMITTAMINYGGKSILREKNLQRYYRELIMFNSNGLNQKIKNLFLTRFKSTF